MQLLSISETFSGRSYYRVIFNDLFQNFATVGIPADLKFYIEIVKEQPTCRNEDGREICQKLYSYYLRIDVSNKTYLIGEDMNDTLFYKHVLNWFINQLHANYSYAFHELGGGGKIRLGLLIMNWSLTIL